MVIPAAGVMHPHYQRSTWGGRCRVPPTIQEQTWTAQGLLRPGLYY